MSKKATNQIEAGLNTVVELTQNTTGLMLKGAVQTTQVSEGFVQGLYKAGYDTNVEALKVAKNYWDASTQIRQDWVKLFAETGEKFIATASNMELPFQKEVTEMGKNVINNVEKTVENFTAQTKAATK